MRPSAVLASALALAAAAATAGAVGSTPAPAAAATTKATAASLGAAYAQPVLFGLGNHTDAERGQTEALINKRASIVSTFATKTNSPDFWGGWAAKMRAAGAVPMLHWDPTPSVKGDPHSSLASVLRGEHDAYIRHWAQQVHAYGHPVLIRLWAEMNGDWEPYSPGKYGNTTAQYVAAWRHVVTVARQAGGTNMMWVWNPNKVYAGETPLNQLYPGDSYVNWVALDLYNWAGVAGKANQTFSSIMNTSVPAIRAVAPRKPLMIAEVGCAESPQKAAWLKDMYSRLAAYKVGAVAYFDYAMDGADWRFRSSAASISAAKAAVAAAPIVGRNQVSALQTEGYLWRGYWK